MVAEAGLFVSSLVTHAQLQKQLPGWPVPSLEKAFDTHLLFNLTATTIIINETSTSKVRTERRRVLQMSVLQSSFTHQMQLFLIIHLQA